MVLLLPCTATSPRLESLKFSYPAHLSFFSSSGKLRNIVVAIAISKPVKKSRKKRQSNDEDDSSSLEASISTMEKGLRFTFMEELIEWAQAPDITTVIDVIYDAIAAGLRPGPHSITV